MSHLGSSEPPKAALWEPSLGSHPYRLDLPSNCPMGSSVFVPGIPIQNQFCCVIFLKNAETAAGVRTVISHSSREA